jgi:hypothetical protein
MPIGGCIKVLIAGAIIFGTRPIEDMSADFVEVV